MKKFYSILITMATLVLLLTLSGCNKDEQNDKGHSVATLPTVDEARDAIEQAGALVTNQYVIARLKSEAFIHYDFQNVNLEELKILVDEAAKAWEQSEYVSAQVEQLAAYYSDNASASIIELDQPNDKDMQWTFSNKVYAAEENAATKWAKDLTEKFDSYPANKKIGELAKYLGTDAKRAFAELQMAQNILAGEGQLEASETFDKLEKAATTLKTLSKAGLYFGSLISSGGATGILETGGMIIGNIDLAVDVFSTGSSIFLGDNHSITISSNKLKDTISPISSLTGAVTFGGANAAEKLSYIGDSILDYVNDGKIIGTVIKTNEKNEVILEMTEIDIANKSPEEVKKELEDKGFTVEEQEEIPVEQRLEEFEKENSMSKEEIDALLEKLRDILYELFAEDLTESEETIENQKEKVVETSNTSDNFDEYLGTYEVVSVGVGNNKQRSGQLTFTKEESIYYVTYDAGEKMVGNFDSDSNTMIFESKTTLNDGQVIFSRLTFQFYEENGKIYFTGTGDMGGDKIVETLFNYTGEKID